jgi:hypothetical protein
MSTVDSDDLRELAREVLADCKERLQKTIEAANAEQRSETLALSQRGLLDSRGLML